MKARSIGVLIFLVFPASETAADASRVEALKEAFAEYAFEKAEERAIESFESKGFARSDSERIIRAGFLQVASCLVDAAIAQAEEEAVPVDDVLDAIEASLSDPEATAPDGDFTQGLIDERAVGLKAEPCLLEAGERMGVASE